MWNRCATWRWNINLKGVLWIFLQKYHAFTDYGHDFAFSSLVAYARYNENISNLKVYYMRQEMWLIPLNLNKTILPFLDIMLTELNRICIFEFHFF